MQISTRNHLIPFQEIVKEEQNVFHNYDKIRCVTLSKLLKAHPHFNISAAAVEQTTVPNKDSSAIHYYLFVSFVRFYTICMYETHIPSPPSSQSHHNCWGFLCTSSAIPQLWSRTSKERRHFPEGFRIMPRWPFAFVGLILKYCSA